MPQVLMRWSAVAAGLGLGLAAAVAAGADPGPSAAASSITDRSEPAARELSQTLPPMPDAVASFGAAVVDDGLYVYGGHIGTTHQHSVDNLSHHFRRLDLAQPETGWQDLGGAVPGLQGLALVPHGRRVCRVGGLDARNAQGDEEDLHSVADVLCFDVDAEEWTALPPLPAPRSSHDAVVLGDRLFVVGGWQLRGQDQEALWHDDALVLDLAAAEPAWRSIPQPFERRALTVATDGRRVATFGGLGPDGTTLDVQILDAETLTWSAGPEMPSKGRFKGFGVSAFGVGERLFLADNTGKVMALGPEGSADQPWVRGSVGMETARVFHRLVAHEDRLLVLGGAAPGGHLHDVEVIRIADWLQPASERLVDRGSWPAFRGAGARLAGAEEMPVRWSDDEGIGWRLPVPGYGQSSPVVWDGQVFVTSVEGDEKQTLLLSAYDLESGEVRWRRRFASSFPEENSDMVSRGAPTPVVDAERVYAFWESGDLIAFDHLGETQWRHSLVDEIGAFEGNHGIASSPVLAGDALVVQVTHGGPSYFVAYDRADGTLRWKTDRPQGVAWSTPVVVEAAAGAQIVSSAAGRVEALAAATGEVLWTFGGVEKNNVPSVTVADDLVIVASSSPSHNFALRPGAVVEGGGALDDGSVAWRAQGVTSGFGSPVLQGGCVLFTNRKGVVTCVDAASGDERWSHRLGGALWASPVARGEHAVFFTEEGKAVVARPTLEGPGALEENQLTFDGRLYGVAAVRGAWLVRTGTELMRIDGVAAGDETMAAR